MIQDEQAKTDEFEAACGGNVDRCFRLMRIWEGCSNPMSTFPLSPSEKAAKRLEIFKRRAKDERYTDRQIDLFLGLQG